MISKYIVIFNHIRLKTFTKEKAVAEKLIAILDVGKTLAKLSFLTRNGKQVGRISRKNCPVKIGEYTALDVEGIKSWLEPALYTLVRQHGPIDAIIPVGHGAAAVIIKNGAIALPPMDYEQEIPADVRAQYDQERDQFPMTGSPSLPAGMNLGRQLAYLEKLHPTALSGDAQILLWPQFWAWVLCGNAASEVTSLGCHTDLWQPTTHQPSSLAITRGWSARLPSLRKAGDVLGKLSDHLMQKCQLKEDVNVYCGIHDSNAALLAARGLPEISGHEATILSTGTWFVAMRSPEPRSYIDITKLDEHRDCLVNVDIHGQIIPSSRFMGGREIEILAGSDNYRIDLKADQRAMIERIDAVIAHEKMVLPNFSGRSGPYPKAAGKWINMPMERMEKQAAIALYAAMMADACLGLVEAQQRILVEGRFAASETFLRALASLRPSDTIMIASTETDVAFGALRLINPDARSDVQAHKVEPLPVDITAYHRRWKSEIDKPRQS
jgi:sugar (pentulose or hexulose) kinase